MKFFVDVNVNDGVYRADILEALDALDKTIAPLETLCSSPRKSEDNDKALEMIVNTRRCLADVLAECELTDENTDDVGQHLRL
jgi:hypothetical protein